MRPAPLTPLRESAIIVSGCTNPALSSGISGSGLNAIDAGLHPTNHTDFVVAPLDQLFMLHSTVNRVSRDGTPVGPDQRVTPLEGLKTMTVWAAEQYGEQASKGTLEAGKLADLVVLDRNPLKVDATALEDIRVVETFKEGVSIHRAE